MPRTIIPPMGFLIAGALVGSGAIWALRLIGEPDLFADSSGAVLGLELLIVSATAGVGMVVSRGRWARNLGWLVIVAELALAAVMAFDNWGWVALAATLGTLVLLSGPWLEGFLRRLPPAEAPANVAVYLALGLLLLPGLVAVSAPAGLEPLHWIAAGAAAIGTWSYSRAMPVGLWGARTLIPVLLMVAALFSPPVGGLLLGIAAIAVLVSAWSRPAALAVYSLVPTATGVAVPPELVPAELLAAAGYDDRGRKREEIK